MLIYYFSDCRIHLFKYLLKQFVFIFILFYFKRVHVFNYQC
jgi:hypothetical protein